MTPLVNLTIPGRADRACTATPEIVSLLAQGRRPYTRRPRACAVCGAADRATKATGCDYLPEAA